MTDLTPTDPPNFHPDFLARRAADMAATYGCSLAEATAAIEAMVGLVRLKIENDNLRAGRCPNCDHLLADHSRGGCMFTLTSGVTDVDLVCQCVIAR